MLNQYQRQEEQLSQAQWNPILAAFINDISENTPAFNMFIAAHGNRDERNELRGKGMPYFLDQMLQKTNILEQLRNLDAQDPLSRKLAQLENLKRRYDPGDNLSNEGGGKTLYRSWKNN